MWSKISVALGVAVGVAVFFGLLVFAGVLGLGLGTQAVKSISLPTPSTTQSQPVAGYGVPEMVTVPFAGGALAAGVMLAVLGVLFLIPGSRRRIIGWARGNVLAACSWAAIGLSIAASLVLPRDWAYPLNAILFVGGGLGVYAGWIRTIMARTSRDALSVIAEPVEAVDAMGKEIESNRRVSVPAIFLIIMCVFSREVFYDISAFSALAIVGFFVGIAWVALKTTGRSTTDRIANWLFRAVTVVMLLLLVVLKLSMLFTHAMVYAMPVAGAVAAVILLAGLCLRIFGGSDARWVGSVMAFAGAAVLVTIGAGNLAPFNPYAHKTYREGGIVQRFFPTPQEKAAKAAERERAAAERERAAERQHELNLKKLETEQAIAEAKAAAEAQKNAGPALSTTEQRVMLLPGQQPVQQVLVQQPVPNEPSLDRQLEVVERLLDRLDKADNDIFGTTPKPKKEE